MIYSILDFGARADGSLCTRQIQDTIDACYLSGGGEVVIPTGTYLVAGLRLRSNVTLHLLENAVLLGSLDPEDYFFYLNDTVEPLSEEERVAYVPTAKAGATLWEDSRPCSRWNNAIVRAYRAKNIAIVGERGSVIDGQNCYDSEGEEGYRGPHAINMWYCENITLQGYTVRHSANWAHAIQNSQQIDVREITVLGGHDGFDIRTCDNIAIANCTFRTGDDCIAGFDNCNVHVRDCYLESACSIFRFGGNNVLIEHCRGTSATEYGHRYKLTDEEKRNRVSNTPSCRYNCLNAFLYYCDNRAEIRKSPGSITFRHCEFQNVDAIMRIPFGHIWCCNRSLSDITFEDCIFDGICLPMRLNCPEEDPLNLLQMKNCTVTGRRGFEDIPLITGTNVKKLELNHVTIKNLSNPEILCDPKIKIIVKN